MQVISFACEVVFTLKALLRGQKLDQAVQVSAKELYNTFESLNMSLENAPRPLNSDESELIDIARGCSAAAAELTSQLEKIWGSRSKWPLKAAVTGTAKRLLNKAKVEELDKVLRSHREILENRLLQRV
jgi:hypothetical protein